MIFAPNYHWFGAFFVLTLSASSAAKQFNAFIAHSGKHIFIHALRK